jgi:hypothetical protein
MIMKKSRTYRLDEKTLSRLEKIKQYRQEELDRAGNNLNLQLTLTDTITYLINGEYLELFEKEEEE